MTLPPDFSDTAGVNWAVTLASPEELRASVSLLLEAYIRDCERAGDGIGGPEAFAAAIPYMHGWDEAYRHIYAPRRVSQ